MRPTAKQAVQLGRALSARLGLAETCLQALHEDPLHHLHLEALLPDTQSLADLDLKNSRSRARLVRQLEHGLDEPVGWLLPLEFNAGRWCSSIWPMRRQQIFLTPGDSPAGLRLPLDSLPADKSIDAEARQMADDNFDASAPLPALSALHDALDSMIATDDEAVEIQQGLNYSARDQEYLVRMALVIENREEGLFVFLPPLNNAHVYVQLIAALEKACTIAVISYNTRSGRNRGQHTSLLKFQ